MPDLEDEEVPSYPVPPQRLAAMDEASRRVGAGGVTATAPLATILGGKDPLAAYEAQAMKEAAVKANAYKQQMALLDQQAQRYGQTGMSDMDKASILFQAAGALAAPTRSGGLMESIGAAGTAVSGPLAKAAQAQRDREDKLAQLQMARARLAGEMGTGEMSSADMLALAKARGEAAKAAAGESRPVTLKINGEEVSAIFKNGKYYDMTGQEITSANMPKKEEGTNLFVPPEVASMGPDAVKKYKERMGTKVADTIEAAEQGAERARRMQPILERAEKAYNTLAKMNAIGNIQGKPEGWSRTIASTFGTTAEQVRQEYEQAAAELQAFKSELLKGQGAITDFERRLLGSTLPKLDAVNAKPGLSTLNFLRTDLQSTIQKPERYRKRGDTGPAPAPAATEKAPMSRADQIRAAEEELKRRQQGQ